MVSANKLNLITQCEKIIKKDYAYYPFQRKLENFSIKDLTEFLKISNGGE